MKNIYFFNKSKKLLNDPVFHLPAAYGSIRAFCEQDSLIKNSYNWTVLTDSISVDESLSKVNNPHIAAFSCFSWSINFSLDLSAAIKSEYPEAKIIFGGPQIPRNDLMSFLEKYEWIDVVAAGEGEVIFKDILYHYHEPSLVSLNKIPGIAYRKNNELIMNTLPAKRVNLGGVNYNPLSLGYYDEFVENKKDGDVLFLAIETNRGCPYSCSFCDWGMLTLNKINNYPFSKVHEEIIETSRKRINVLFISDANFGIFDRDIDFAKIIVDEHRKTGFPESLGTGNVKNNPENWLKIKEILKNTPLEEFYGISTQTVTEEVLQNSGRSNITLEKVLSREKIVSQLNKKQTFTELIIGLPGETKQSFTNSLLYLLELNIFSTIMIYHHAILPGSPEVVNGDIDKYKMRTFDFPYGDPYLKQGEKKYEYLKTVVETETMSSVEMAEAYVESIFYVALQTNNLISILTNGIKNKYDISVSNQLMAVFTEMKESKTMFFSKIIKDFTSSVHNGYGCYDHALEQLRLDYFLTLKNNESDIRTDPVLGITLILISLRDDFFELIQKVYQSEFRICLSENDKDLFEFQKSILLDFKSSGRKSMHRSPVNFCLKGAEFKAGDLVLIIPKLNQFIQNSDQDNQAGDRPCNPKLENLVLNLQQDKELYLNHIKRIHGF